MEIASVVGVSRDTVVDDYHRLVEVARDSVLGNVAESVARLRHLHRSALDAFEATAISSLNRSAYLSVARQCVMYEAKLLGQEPRQRVEVAATLHNGDLDIDAEIDRIFAQRLARP
ncbi:MAG TPA: hypothetical protein VMW47_05505 [Verrucomicrobiae bacterium]|nr:hypothetical protein [Verrucomicrobiae bacterium]